MIFLENASFPLLSADHDRDPELVGLRMYRSQELHLLRLRDVV